MKKKLLITALLSVFLLGVGFYTVLASSSGYDAYKTALMETHKIKSGVANIEFSISNNGDILQELTMQTAYNLDEKRSVATMNLKTATDSVELQMHTQENKIYIENGVNRTTYVIESKHDSAKMKEKHAQFHNKELLKVAELVVDTLTQPLHDHFKLDADHSISVDLTNDEIPAAIHALSSYMVKKSFSTHANIEMKKEDYPFLTNNIKQALPAITEEIRFDQINVIAQLNENNQLQNQQAFFQISGKDDQGKSHIVMIEFNIEMDKINETNVSALNLAGKKLETLELKKFHKIHK